MKASPVHFCLCCGILAGWLLGRGVVTGAENRLIVEDGLPRAEIVIAGQALRPTRLAAQELQDGIRKISGARLPIVTAPSQGRVRIFVGPSEHTEKLKLTASDLRHGAYRMVSGEDWLALIGIDSEFTPIEPWAKNNSQIVEGGPLRDWREKTRSSWNLPNVLIYKNRFTVPGETGLPDSARLTEKMKPLEMWAEDERGSFNAVCGYLHGLGVRWYAPDEIGEVFPSLKTIPLGKFNETARPDFSIRRFNVRFGVHGEKMARWAMRLGFRDPYGIESAHGMDTIADNEETFKAHPEWFAMYGGRRRYQRGANNHLCYSNLELVEETARYVREVFDRYKFEVVSIMPPDGYTAICQCEKCAGKDAPGRDQQALASDHVWGFVNRVAREVAKTHPEKKVMNCAYGIYSSPPPTIDRIEPNVVVSIVGGRRPMSNRPEQQAECRALREAWLGKTSNPIVIFENYPLTDRGWYLPAFTPRSIGESINSTKGFSQGEDIWLSMYQPFEKDQAMGLNHFMVYFTQRMYWGGRSADVEGMFNEYVRLFYGPAGPEMKAFLEYCEGHWQEMEKRKEVADTALALFERAKAKAGKNDIHGRRILLIDDFLKGLRHKSAQLGKLRGPMPTLRLVGPPRGPIKVDGILDEEAWTGCPVAATALLRELQTGRQPVFGTQVKAAWLGNDLYFAIRCEEPRGEKPNIGTTRKDDSALWNGDAVEVLIETESHSYYQVAVGPTGAVCDLDHAVESAKRFSWDSRAEVATHVGDGHWTVEMRLPIRPDENDPLNQVVGRHPNRGLPWHINVCRQRIRDDGSEYSALSPTGTDGFHSVMKFATFFDGNSHMFDHGPADDDFLEAMRRAADFAREGNRPKALDACVAAAKGKVTDLQKSHALELAAGYATSLKRLEMAQELIAAIPIPACRMTATMRHLLDTTKASELVSKFGDEEISRWPFWKRGEGFLLRGTARFITKSGRLADDDLKAALPFISERSSRDLALLTLGQNRESVLGDDAGALPWFESVVANRTTIGSSSEFAALQGIARIQTRRGQLAEAVKTLERAQPAKLQGYWRSAIDKQIEDLKKAQ